MGRDFVIWVRRKTPRQEPKLRHGLLKEVPTYKLITPSIVSERLKVRGSLARRALDELVTKGLIRQVVQHRAQLIYTRVTKDEDEEDENAEEEKEEKTKGKKGKK